eukprot:COSAG02_NODE_695_length_18407_cov_105.138573_3_plen_635_part_00
MGRKPLPKSTQCKVGGWGPTRRGVELQTGGCLASRSSRDAQKIRHFNGAATVLKHWRETLDAAAKAEAISGWAVQQTLSSVQWNAPFAELICGCCEQYIDVQLVPRAKRFDASRLLQKTESQQIEAAASGAALMPRNSEILPFSPLGEPELQHIVHMLDPRSAARLAATCKLGLALFQGKAILENMETRKELLELRAEFDTLSKAYDNGFRGIVKLRVDRDKAQQKLLKLQKGVTKQQKADRKELEQITNERDRLLIQHKHDVKEIASLTCAVRALLTEVKEQLHQRVVGGDGAVSDLDGIVVRMRAQTRGRPVLNRWRDQIAKLHVFYTLGQEKCVPALVDVIEGGGATVIDAPSKSDYVTLACTHEQAEFTRFALALRMCRDVCGPEWKPIPPRIELHTPRLARPDCSGVVVPRQEPLGSWITSWVDAIEWAKAGSPKGWFERKLATIGLTLPKPVEIDLQSVAADNPAWYFPGPWQHDQVQYLDPAPGYAGYAVGSDGFSNFADISCTSVSIGMGRSVFRSRGWPGLDEQADMAMLALIQEVEGSTASAELASVLEALYDATCHMAALGVPAHLVLRPIDFFEMMLDNTSAMTGRFKGLHTLFEQVRGPSVHCVVLFPLQLFLVGMHVLYV